MGSDESHFNVSLIVKDKVTSQCPLTTALSSLQYFSGKLRQNKLLPGPAQHNLIPIQHYLFLGFPSVHHPQGLWDTMDAIIYKALIAGKLELPEVLY